MMTTIKKVLRNSALSYLSSREKCFSSQPVIIMLMAHMRSGSHLLHHILSSHPQVLGCGERNLPFKSEQDFALMARQIYYNRREFVRRCDYLVDVINHNHLLLKKELIGHQRVKVIFLIRSPESAITSMAEHLGKLYGMSLEQAIDYYCDRLEALAGYADFIQSRRRAIFVRYEDLVRESKVTLARLETFLGLSTPISPRFDTFGKGSEHSSIHLTGGKIVSGLRADTVVLSTVQQIRLHRVYEHCLARLSMPGKGV